MLQRNEMNMGWETLKSNGIPITLKVPTHFRVAIVDVKYAHRNDDLGWMLLSDDRKAVASVQVDHDFIYTEKVFTVDPKRPAAGDIDFTLELAEDQQYLEKVTSDITDRTIQETSMAFERLFVAFRSGTGEALDRNIGTSDNPLAPIESVRAMQVFEIDDPMFEQNLAAFLAEQFCDNCNSCPPLILNEVEMKDNDAGAAMYTVPAIPFADATSSVEN
jgi:hypothetical protein